MSAPGMSSNEGSIENSRAMETISVIESFRVDSIGLKIVRKVI